MQPSLVYVHIGKQYPECLTESLHQTLLTNGSTCKVFVVVDDTLVNKVQHSLDNLNVDTFLKGPSCCQNVVQIVPTSVLDETVKQSGPFEMYKQAMEGKGVEAFRDGFWISTTSRFFYIHALTSVFQLTSVFHIENDIVMYESFETMMKEPHFEPSKVCMVQDSPTRVVPSLLYFPDVEATKNLTQFIAETVSNSPVFMNDMDILGRYVTTHSSAHALPIHPTGRGSLVFDGAAIGQYIGGVDIRNVDGFVDLTERRKALFAYANNTVGFVNETSTFKPNTCEFVKRDVVSDDHIVPIKTLMGINRNRDSFRIANAHIHSKQLYKFSSVFDMQFTDIITGDRVLELCDFVLTTRDIMRFHRNIEKFARDIIVVKDFQSVDIARLNQYFVEKKSKTVKLFLYTHMLDQFIEYIAPHLESSLEYVLYLHNSDHSFQAAHKELLGLPYIKHVFAQNVDYVDPGQKLSLLPIGIANSMWPHGDILELYTVMKDTYKNKKTKGLYVNLSANTFGYRKDVLDALKAAQCCELASAKPYGEYLRDLARHRFCLCLRGNGLDTHRFWEALYLGVIPVVVNNAQTSCDVFCKYLRDLNVPFVEVTSESVTSVARSLSDEHFSQKTYEREMRKFGKPFGNADMLKLSYYTN